MNKVLIFFIYIVYFTTPLESVAIIQGFSVVKLASILFFAISLLSFPKIKITKPTFFLYFFTYTLLTIISSTWSIDFDTTINSSIGMILPTFLISIIIFHSIKEKKQIDNIFKAYYFGSLIIMAVAIYMYLTGFRFAVYEVDSRLTVLGQDANELSFLLSFGVVSGLYLVKYTSQRKLFRYFIYFSIIILSFIILTTGSRTGFIILSVIIIVLIMMNFQIKRSLLIVPIVIAMVTVILNILPELILNRLFETSDQIKQMSLTGRVDIWELGWSAFQKEDSFLFGTGFKTFPNLFRLNYGIAKAPHNTYLSTMIELGFVGLFLYFSMISFLLRQTFNLAKLRGLFFALLILPILLAMFTLGTETRRWLFLIGILIIKLNQFAIINKFDESTCKTTSNLDKV